MLRSCVLALIIVGKLEVLCGRVMQKWCLSNKLFAIRAKKGQKQQWPPEKGHFIIAAIAVAFHMMLFLKYDTETY